MTPIEYVDVNLIDPHPQNPRRHLGSLTELANSIKAQGIQQNLLLVPNGDRYTVVIGHRRLAAAKLAGLDTVPAITNPRLSDSEQTYLMLLENVQRTDLTPIEEAEGYQQLLDLGVTAAAIAKKAGIAAKTVKGRLQLLTLPEVARERIHNGQASLLDAAKLEKLDPEIQTVLADVLGTKDFDYKITEALRRQRDRAAQAEIVAALEAAGVPARPPRDSGEPFENVSYDRHVYKVEDVTSHKFPEGCRYEASEHSASVMVWRPSTADPAQLEAIEQARIAGEAARAEHLNAWETRDQFVRSLLDKAGKAKLTSVQRDAILQAARADLWTGSAPSPVTIGRWLDPSLGSDVYPTRDQVLTQLAAEPWSSLDPALHLLLWLHLRAGIYADWDELQPVYTMLGRLGYVPSEIETERLAAAAASTPDKEG